MTPADTLLAARPTVHEQHLEARLRGAHLRNDLLRSRGRRLPEAQLAVADLEVAEAIAALADYRQQPRDAELSMSV